MIQIRKSNERGHADHGWLNTYHTFSFAGYHDPQQMGFRALRVINEDRVAAAQGFGTHAHENMEIVSYVLEGELAHKDSMGNGAVLTPGEFQRISAGTGIEHSEFNASPTELVHFYQIWLKPNQRGLPPSYEQKRFADDGLHNAWRLIASPDGENGSIIINSDARVLLTKLETGKSLIIEIADGRHGWLQILRGGAIIDDITLDTSDGAAISEVARLQVVATADTEIMFFDLA